jgi:hypothetical protein
MGIKFGEIDAGQILDNEFRIGVLESILEWVLNNNHNLTKPTQYDIEEIRKTVIGKLQQKYPKSGITYKGA